MHHDGEHLEHQSLPRTQTHNDFIKTIRGYKEDEIQCHVQLWKFHIAFFYLDLRLSILPFLNVKLLGYNIEITFKEKWVENKLANLIAS